MPKALFRANPNRALKRFAIFTYLLYILLYPLSRFTTWLSCIIMRMFNIKVGKETRDTTFSKRELNNLIQDSIENAKEEEEIDNDVRIFQNVLDFSNIKVRECLVPRTEIEAVEVNTPLEELKSMFIESGHSKIVVFKENIDNIIGILYYKDLYAALYNTLNPDIKEIIKPVIYVAKTQNVNDLMKELQEKQLHLAVVTDEFGSTAGLVTLEDILEEIVGEIWDEHDEIVMEIEKISDCEYIVSGKANLEKLFDELDIDIPEGEEESDAVTVNGWAMDTLGKIAEEGDSFEALGLAVKVLKMEGRRIENLHIRDLRPGEDCDCEESSEENE